GTPARSSTGSISRSSSRAATARSRRRWARPIFRNAETHMLSRRIFLKQGACACVSLGFAPSFLARTAYAAGGASRARRLVAIFQRGASDGLSVVVPFGEREYYRARPGIAVARPRSGDDAAIDLDGFFGFNPRLAPLEPLWKARQLAV